MPPGAITVENWGNPVRKGKIGDSFTFWHGGVAVTLTLTSLAHVTDYPKELDDPKDPGVCGNFWLAEYTIKVGAKNSTWPGWFFDVTRPLPFLKNGDTFDGQTETGPSRFGDKGDGSLVKAMLQAGNKDRDGGKITFTDQFTGKEYYPVCKNDHEARKMLPTDVPLAGVRWRMQAPDDVDPHNNNHDLAEWWL